MSASEKSAAESGRCEFCFAPASSAILDLRDQRRDLSGVDAIDLIGSDEDAVGAASLLLRQNTIFPISLEFQQPLPIIFGVPLHAEMLSEPDVAGFSVLDSEIRIASAVREIAAEVVSSYIEHSRLLQNDGDPPYAVDPVISVGQWNVAASGQIGKHGPDGYTVWL